MNSTTQTQHTVIPWHVHEEWARIINSADGNGERPICKCAGPDGSANAEFIVRACNSHADLLAALEGALDTIEAIQFKCFDMLPPVERINRILTIINNSDLETSRAALARARGL